MHDTTGTSNCTLGQVLNLFLECSFAAGAIAGSAVQQAWPAFVTTKPVEDGFQKERLIETRSPHRARAFSKIGFAPIYARVLTEAWVRTQVSISLRQAFAHLGHCMIPPHIDHSCNISVNPTLDTAHIHKLVAGC